MTLSITSPAFAQNARIPDRYTGEGDDISPRLEWSGVPEGTHSLVVLCDDPDAPRGIWHHWAAFDIPEQATSLDEDRPKAIAADHMHQAVNDFGRAGYGGPYPPTGHGTHHYRFRLLALDTDTLGLEGSPSCHQVEAACTGHVLEEARLVGTYSRGKG